MKQASAGFEQGSDNYLGSNRLLRLLQGSWPYGPPPSPNTQWSAAFQSSPGIFSVPRHSQCSPGFLRNLPAFVSVLLAFNWKQLSFTGLPSTCPCVGPPVTTAELLSLTLTLILSLKLNLILTLNLIPCLSLSLNHILERQSLLLLCKF